ncbi:YwbE family protein [Leadbetterella sp. DM7]|uniref:YwbE family protein n=1 Tax=Leadbetterella sp. DM7 TaxID=3235085 RepID=UPI00349E9A6D
MAKDGKTRADIRPGMLVNIILKKDQRTGELTEGVVKNILTSAPYHHRGIKVRLEDGQIGRVAEILPDEDF